MAGVNLVGYLAAESGMGQVARSVADGARLRGHDVTEFPLRQTLSRQTVMPRSSRSWRTHGTNIIAANADRLPLVADRIRPLLRGRYNIGYWAWELGTFPPELAASADLLDEIWTLSDFAAESIRASVDIPVRVCPLPISASVEPTAAPPIVGRGDRKAILFCFDFFSVSPRKNPQGIVAAYRQAFPQSSDDVVLIIKTINGRRDPVSLGRLQAAAAGRDDIIINDGYLRPEQQFALIDSAYAYISLHRAEGLGLTLAEAMILGKPTIATGYSGNLQFMNPLNSYLVGYELVPVGGSYPPYPSDAVWAEPNVSEAAEAIRVVVKGGRDVEERAANGRADVDRLLSPSACADVLDDLLRGRSSPVTEAKRPRILAMADNGRTRVRLASPSGRFEDRSTGPAWLTATRHSAAAEFGKGLARRLVERWARVDEIEAKVSDLRCELARLEALQREADGG